MIKIQIKRVKWAKNYEYNRLDSKFVNGSIHSFPKKGECLAVMFDKLGWGTWHTSPVVRVYETKSGITVKTKNSLYHIRKDWMESI